MDDHRDAGEVLNDMRLLVSRLSYQNGQLVQMLKECERHCVDGFVAEKARELLAEHGVHVSDGSPDGQD